jgi:uncharacterized protein (DUF1499 family)
MSMALTRRRMFDEPPSQLAIWARRLAIFAVVVAVLAIGIEQWGGLETIPMLVTFGSSLALALMALIIAGAAFVMLWINGGPGAGAAITATVIGLLLLGYPVYLGYLAYTLPAIKDITTDPIDPPKFEVVARLRPANTSAYQIETAAQQKDAYPDVEPLLVKVNPTVAYEDAMKVIAKKKWRVVDARTPQPGRDGHIEAIARSPIMGFRDDVVVRIRPARDGGTRIDARSASRYGYTDFGANAARVEALLDEIDDLASIPERPAKPATPAKPDPKKQQQQPQRGGVARR